MTKRRKVTYGDPRKLSGQGIVGPGGPADRHAVVIDAENAILPTAIEGAMVEPDPGSGRKPLAAITISGRINKSPDEVTMLYMMDVEGAGQLAAAIAGAFVRYGPIYAHRFSQAFDRELARQTDPEAP